MNIVCRVLCLASLVTLTPAFGQEVSYTAIEPTVNAQCIDYPPLGDGFGWNGRCGCLVEPEWTGFGTDVAISGNTLAIGSVETPERCAVTDTRGFSFPPSTSVSIYERSASGSWIKETEFQPNEGEGFFSLAFDDDGKLHIGRKVYGSVNGEWQLLTTLDTVSSQFADIVSEAVQGGLVYPPRYPSQFTTVFQDSVLIMDIANTIHRWIRGENGAWVKLEEFASNMPYPYSWQEVVPFPSDNKLLLTTEGHFRSYVLNNENKLVEAESLELPGAQWIGIWAGGDSYSTITAQIDFDGAQLLTGDPRNNIVYIFDEVFDDGNNAAPSVAECDYSSADLFDGWGWNATTSESCPPLVSTATAQCVDSDGDGFGWDGTATCIPASTIPATSPGADSNCDYSDANLYGGWGWNATASQSCAPLESTVDPQPATECVDTDGDGWGWNSITLTSCAI